MLFYIPQVIVAQNPDENVPSITSNESTKKFIKDMKRFVRSVNKEKYQSAGYWEEVDKLWKVLQVRKKNLEGNFNDSQIEQIRKLEWKYQTLKTKKTKLSTLLHIDFMRYPEG
jgi:hypothetical protein